MYFVRLRKDGRRYTRSLETKDPATADKRAQQALEELEHLATPTGQQKWRADEPAVIGEQQPDGSFVERQTTWAEIAEPQQIHVTSWRDLVNETVAVRKRKKGEDYSEAWYNHTSDALKLIPFTF